MFTPDTVIQERFRIVRPLASVRGESYEGVDETNQQPVTIQVWELPNPSALERIKHAASARARSVHSILPTMVATVVENDRYILVTSRDTGETLANQQQARGEPFAPEQAVAWTIQLLDALMILHRQSPTLAHGDIGPKTVQMSDAGELNLLGVDLYTVGGTSAPTEEKDLYDTSALLYYLVTGVQPPTMAGRAERGFLPPADSLNPAVPRTLALVLEQGLSANPDERFNSAYTLQNALLRVQSQFSSGSDSARTAPSLADKLRQRRDVPADNPATTQGYAAIYPTATNMTNDSTEPLPEEGATSEPSPFDAATQPFAAGAQSSASETSAGEQSAPPPHSEMGDEREVPPPPVEPPPATSSGSGKNRLWFALGMGCITAILCVCCGLIALISSQWDTIVSDLESQGITLDEEPGGRETPPDGVEAEGEPISVFDITIGDCLDYPEDGELIEEFLLMDCNAPHDYEVYAFGQFPADDGAEFPGEEEIDAFSEEICLEAYGEYVGTDYNDSAYYVRYLQPTEQSWAEGDHEVVCMLYDRDGKMEGSKANSRE